MFRILVLLHRYIGIGISLMLLLWCVSGFIMLYVQFPELDALEQRQLLPVIDLKDCCRLPDSEEIDIEPVDYFAIEMVADHPVLRLGWYPADEIAIDMQQGAWLEPMPPTLAARVAADYRQRRRLDGELEYLGTIITDQWTVTGNYNRHRPLHHYTANDAAGTEWYISGTSGEIVQITTARERFWNWLGSVTHWLYFTGLREDAALWSRVIIGLAVLGTFLTVIGITIGIRQFRFNTSVTPRTPYTGWRLWHHYAGLVFGLFALTWVFSGLLSMNPWGLLEGDDAAEENRLLEGQPIPWADVAAFVHSLPARSLPARLSGIAVSSLQGGRNLVVHYPDGGSRRLDYHTWQPVAISPGQWQALTELLQQEGGTAVGDMLDAEDEYYYNHHETRTFPVWRVVMTGDSGTRYYIDPLNGLILEKFDGNRQWYRWLFWALHRGDFLHALRIRPVWDIFMLLLLAGTTLVTVTGTYLGYKRLSGR
jgi:uncharacterized iron-regulated membrane protein